MSRYQIQHGVYCIAVGWDRPLDTYFAIVEDITDEEAEEELVSIGMMPGEYRDVETFTQALQKALSEKGIDDFTLPPDILSRLEADYRDNPPGTGTAEKSPEVQRMLQNYQRFIEGKDL